MEMDQEISAGKEEIQGVRDRETVKSSRVNRLECDGLENYCSLCNGRETGKQGRVVRQRGNYWQ